MVRAPTEEPLPTRAAIDHPHAGDANLRRSEMLGAILDAAPDPVAPSDGAGRVRYANPACEAIFGAVLAEIVERDLAELTALPDADTELAPNEVRRGPAERRLPDGDTRWIAYSAGGVRRPAGVDR